jgi:predicted cupin superfamily sugar epimerase
MTDLDVNAIIQLLGLEPLPVEGGLFCQTYRSVEEMPPAALPGRYAGEAQDAPARPLATAIFYLLTSRPAENTLGKIASGNLAPGNQTSFSAFHRLRSDEIFHFYLGDPLELTLLYPDGSSRQVILGQDIFQGQQLQFVIPHGVWQGTRLVAGGRFALIGTTMAPGYTDGDYEHGDRAALLAQYPHERERILALTR